MHVTRSFRNLDAHGRDRAPAVIAAETALLERRLTRFRPELVRLEVTLSQTSGKMRIHASLRLELPSGVIAARAEGFETEPVLRAAFAELGHRLERHLARLRHDWRWKRPARRARIGTLLPPARAEAEAARRALFFKLIEDHLDAVYDQVRRELTYLEASGSVRAGDLSVRGLVDATILRGLARFENRPGEFSVGDWLRKLALETIAQEARQARRAIPEDAESLERSPQQPAEEPTEADQEMFEFYQPDDLLRLEDLVADDSAEDPQSGLERREAALAVHRALADLPALWRAVLVMCDLEDSTPEQAAAILELPETEVTWIAKAARGFVRQKLIEGGHAPETSSAALGHAAARLVRVPQPLAERDRIANALAAGEQEVEA
ncbi:MAG: hypothetical protein Kow0058_15300 [Roseovarius sp.]